MAKLVRHLGHWDKYSRPSAIRGADRVRRVAGWLRTPDRHFGYQAPQLWCPGAGSELGSLRSKEDVPAGYGIGLVTHGSAPTVPVGAAGTERARNPVKPADRIRVQGLVSESSPVLRPGRLKTKRHQVIVMVGTSATRSALVAGARSQPCQHLYGGRKSADDRRIGGRSQAGRGPGSDHPLRGNHHSGSQAEDDCGGWVWAGRASARACGWVGRGALRAREWRPSRDLPTWPELAG